MFNINLEEAELELKEVKENTLDYTKNFNIFESLEGVQTTLDVMVEHDVFSNIFNSTLLLESSLVLQIIKEDEEGEESDSNEEDSSAEDDGAKFHKSKGFFKTLFAHVKRIFMRLIKLLRMRLVRQGTKWAVATGKIKAAIVKADDQNEKERLNILKSKIHTYSGQIMIYSVLGNRASKKFFKEINHFKKESDLRNKQIEILIKYKDKLETAMDDAYKGLNKVLGSVIDGTYIKQAIDGDIGKYDADIEKNLESFKIVASIINAFPFGSEDLMRGFAPEK